ncbi:hypothetical protein ABZ671_32100 [Micromonospora sp. NPDC006766]|uniref:hypothetical protein n=1 Tax=Micromonospora sp. NPDC006766 TaxID=3154778 RepID=UPI0033F94F4D
MLGNQRGHLMRELRNLDALRRAADDPVVRLLLSAASRHVEADLAFVDDAEPALLNRRRRDPRRVGLPRRRARGARCRPGPARCDGGEQGSGNVLPLRCLLSR